jgi:predicted metal-dependent phosphoesterase TrpH
VTTGLWEAEEAARRVGVEFVAGVELTADWNSRVCHILGYGIEPRNPSLGTALLDGRLKMEQHVQEVLAVLREEGHELVEQDLSRYNTRYATGSALVLAMVERGILRSSRNPRRLLALASREPRAYTAVEAIRLIQGAGGVASLAHPARLRRDEPLLPASTFRPLVDAGLDGLEVWQIVHGQAARRHYQGVAGELGLLSTGGSDCHGPRSTGVRIGSQEVPYQVFSALLERLAERRAQTSRP